MAIYTIVKQDNAVKITNDLGAIVDIKSRAVVTGRPATDYHGDYVIIGWNVSGNIPQGLKIFINDIDTIEGNPAAGTLEGVIDQLMPLFVSTAGTLTELADFPASYVGAGGFYLKVANDESGVEFFDLNSYLSSTYMLGDRTITINGVTKAVSSNPSFTVSGGGGGASVVSLTYADATILAGADGLTPGQMYCITDAHTALYGGTEVFLMALTTNSFEESATGKFYNPQYNNSETGRGIWRDFGTYNPTNVIGFFEWNEEVDVYDSGDNYLGKANCVGLGGSGLIVTTADITTGTYFIGNSSAAVCFFNSYDPHPTAPGGSIIGSGYDIGESRIWGGKKWTNLTGSAGNPIDTFTLDGTNWDVVAYNDIDYNVVYDTIIYDFANDLIVYREDNVGNKVEATSYPTSLAYFQWGSGDISSGMGMLMNSVSNGSFVNTINYAGKFFVGNTFSTFSSWGGADLSSSVIAFGNIDIDAVTMNHSAIAGTTFYGGSSYAYIYDTDMVGNYWGIYNSSFYDSGIYNSNLKLDQSQIQNYLAINSQWNSTDFDQLEYWYKVNMINVDFLYNRLSQLYINNVEWRNGYFNYNESNTYFGLVNTTLSNWYCYSNLFSDFDFGWGGTITDTQWFSNRFYSSYPEKVIYDNVNVLRNTFTNWQCYNYYLYLTNIDVQYNNITNWDMNSGASMDSYLGSASASRSNFNYNSGYNWQMYDINLPTEFHFNYNTSFGQYFYFNSINTTSVTVNFFQVNNCSGIGFGIGIQEIEFSLTATNNQLIIIDFTGNDIYLTNLQVDGSVAIYDINGQHGSFDNLLIHDNSQFKGWTLQGTNVNWCGIKNLEIPANKIVNSVTQQTTQQIDCAGLDISSSTLIYDSNIFKTMIDDGSGNNLPANARFNWFSAPSFNIVHDNLDA